MARESHRTLIKSPGLDLDLDILLQVTYLFTAHDSLHDSTIPNQP